MKKGKGENKNWIIILTAIVVVCLPLILNEFMMCKQIRDYVGESKDWLGFWGGYIGAIISAIVAFTVLNKQIKQNQTENKNNQNSNQLENKENRDANQRENERNRRLQVKTIKYQQEKGKLEVLRNACNDYSFNLDCNDLIQMNTLLNNHKQQEASLIAKKLLDKIARSQAKIIFLLSPKDIRNDNEKEFYNQIIIYGNRYLDVVLDMQTIDHFNTALRLEFNTFKTIGAIKDAEETLSERIIIFINSWHDSNPYYSQNILVLLREYIKTLHCISMDMQNIALKYLYEEDNRINSILD